MGWLDNLFKSVGSPEAGPSGERPGRGFGDVTAEGSGESYAEPEQQQQVIESARVEDTANLARLMLDVPPRLTLQPSRRIQGGGAYVVRGAAWSDEQSFLIGFQPDRQRIWLWSSVFDSAYRVWVGGSAEDARTRGFRVPANNGDYIEPMVLRTRSALYVRLRNLYGVLAPTGTSDKNLLYYLIEFGE